MIVVEIVGGGGECILHVARITMRCTLQSAARDHSCPECSCHLTRGRGDTGPDNHLTTDRSGSEAFNLFLDEVQDADET